MVRRIKEYLKKRAIKEQILVAMIMSTMLSAVLLGFILFSFSKRTIENNYQSANEHNLEVSGGIIDIYLKSFVELSRTLLNHQTFKTTLLSETNSGAYFSSTNSRILEHILIDLGEQSRYIQNITVVSCGGNILFQSKLNREAGNMQRYYKDNNILAADWVAAAEAAKGKEVFFGDNVLFDDGDETFSMVKKLNNPDNSRPMGYVVFNIKKTLFQKAFAKSGEAYATNRYLIIDRNVLTAGSDPAGQVVYFTGDDSQKALILHQYADQNNAVYLFSESHSDESGWEIVDIIEKRELSRDSSYIGWITVLVCAGMLLVCILISTKISRMITRPLLLLEKMIQRVGDGKYRVDAEFDESEAGRIGNQFKSMVNNNLDLHEKLLQSIIREQEAELLLLQSQINPHFLYNTLDSLYFMALIEEADDIAEMVLALSDTFKLSLNKGDKLIRVTDELDKIRAYIKIQNMRYGGRFRTEIEIDEELGREKMLTFILQPLVENAIYHGLEPKLEDECLIRIKGVREEKRMCFIISDNGVGIADLAKLNDGYGVSNIKARIGLFYGGEGEISFASTPGKGTEVTVRLPLIGDGEESGENYVSFGGSR